MAPGRRRIVVLLTAGAAVLAVVLVALFLLGHRAGQGAAPSGEGAGQVSDGAGPSGEATAPSGEGAAGEADAAAPTPAATPDARPAPSTDALPPAPTAPAAPGEHPYSELFGGECLGAFVSPWEPTFSVVDCAAAHPAQLTLRGLLPEPAGAPYPGEAELASRMNLLCTAPTALAPEAAADPADLRWQAAFPVDADDWNAGDRVFHCFVSTASGAPLTGSLVP